MPRRLRSKWPGRVKRIIDVARALGPTILPLLKNKTRNRRALRSRRPRRAPLRAAPAPRLFYRNVRNRPLRGSTGYSADIERVVAPQDTGPVLHPAHAEVLPTPEGAIVKGSDLLAVIAIPPTQTQATTLHPCLSLPFNPATLYNTMLHQKLIPYERWVPLSVVFTYTPAANVSSVGSLAFAFLTDESEPPFAPDDTSTGLATLMTNKSSVVCQAWTAASFKLPIIRRDAPFWFSSLSTPGHDICPGRVVAFRDGNAGTAGETLGFLSVSYEIEAFTEHPNTDIMDLRNNPTGWCTSTLTTAAGAVEDPVVQSTVNHCGFALTPGTIIEFSNRGQHTPVFSLHSIYLVPYHHYYGRVLDTAADTETFTYTPFENFEDLVQERPIRYASTLGAPVTATANYMSYTVVRYG